MYKSASEVQNAFAQSLNMKSDRRTLSENIRIRQERIMDYIESSGQTLVFNANDRPVMLFVNRKPVTKLDKAALAGSIGESPRKLTPTYIAELVETGRLTSDAIAEFERTEISRSLKTRRASKKEIEQFRNVK